ncbi:sigma-E factor negative regulatory protein [Psychromonas sp. Urea-02u-13]|uniref:sigma-E factor negative regulatory protein n=1 Tax=Psychromonas sp. Urea-02u-13 TaxID=2058326 RepID=UPI000C34508B|nr:RseA family anti-sigma factor [Psychromonas sp. Urea-02u-13]PKG38169.1 anti-sigma 24 factor [Psychromonas sp. Urea-02u-13]
MTEINEQLSSLIDNENVESKSLDALIHDKEQQDVFSRYHLIGDVMRNETALNIDISELVMAEIAQQPSLATVTPITATVVSEKSDNNVVSFMKRFGQYAIAASVAGVVVMTSFITSQPTLENNGIEVLNTVPFGGGVSPVSLQANKGQSKQALQDRHERLEALLKDHQLQLQVQP